MKVNSIILSTALLLITLLVIEITLRIFTPFPIHAFKANQVDDDILSHRLDQSLGGIDSNGFRNASVPESADIVAIGDSHTYGVNAGPGDSWPGQLAAMANMTTYNFGVSGYNILQYEHLINEAIGLKPRYVIVGLYPSNDLKACKLLRRLEYWKEWATARGYDTSACPAKKKKKKQRSRPGNFNIAEFVMHETATGSLTVYVWDLVSLRFGLGKKGQSVIINHDSNPTITTSGRLAKHSKNMDLTQPAAALGFEITKDVLVEAGNRLDKHDIELIVMFIPSKESIYREFLEDSGYPVPQEYHDLVANEKDVVDKLATVFDNHGIDHVNAGPYVTDAVNQSGKVYANTGDGHPLKAGYEAYAKAVYENSFAPQ